MSKFRISYIYHSKFVYFYFIQLYIQEERVLYYPTWNNQYEKAKIYSDRAYNERIPGNNGEIAGNKLKGISV